MKGFLQVLIRDKKSGQLSKISQTNNLIVYQSGDILAKISAGDSSFAPTHIYGEHVPGATYVDGNPSGLSAALTDQIAQLRVAPRSTTGAEEAIVSKSFNYTTEYPVGTPVSYWIHNHVIYTAVISDASVDTRQFIGAGLVTVVNGQEYLFAHTYHNVITKLSSFELVYIWTVRYT